MFPMKPMPLRKGYGNMQKIVALYPGLETTQIIELSLTWTCSELP